MIRRKKIYGIGLILSVMLLVLFSVKEVDTFKMPGTIMPGHEKLACKACHVKEKGSIRQQLQSNVMNWLDIKKMDDVTFMYKVPQNNDCLSCHRREDDNHPVYRFKEPKYKKVREKIHPENCVSCHNEHEGSRVTIAFDYCKNCHENLVLKKDPLKVSHKVLIEGKKWSTCLRCHDFHGNHDFKVPVEEKNMIDQSTLKHYLDNGKNPYGKILTKAKESRDEN